MDAPERVLAGRGGYITLPAWRDDIGALPVGASLSIPDLDISDRPATILRDGLIRARINAREAVAGTYEVFWTLEVPVYGTSILADAPPVSETIEADGTLEIVTDPALCDPSRHWFDADGFPTPAYVRAKQLFGIPPIDGDGRLLQDQAIATSLAAARARVERELGIILGRRLVTSTDYTPPPGSPPVLEEAPYDYAPSQFRINYGYMRLRRYPVRTFHKLELWIGPKRVAEIPESWIHLNKSQGDIQIMAGTMAGLALPGSLAMPIVTGTYGGPIVPHLWRATYEAGWPATPDLLEVISMIATQTLLIIISDSTIAGIASQSVSLDGVSESISTTSSATNSTYGANITELEKRIKGWFEKVGPSYTGVRVVVA